jgi:hypothetical protein
MDVLAADATWTSDGGGKTKAAKKVVSGAEHVARFGTGVFHRYLGQMEFRDIEINGEAGIAAMYAGQLISVISIRTDGHRILGVFSILLGLHGIFNPVLRRAISQLWSIPAGIVGGAIATVFGAGGPIYATYLSGRLTDKAAHRSTVSTLISISSLTRALIFAVAGLLLHWTLFAGFVLMLPFMWIGMKAGSRIHVGLTQLQMRRVVGALLIVTGITLVLRAGL